ncbi:MAG: hypothetical protein HXX13_09170 [Bacteroidetes bacterium]|nr:hypothetical protein [Bacteroidota bacterium]
MLYHQTASPQKLEVKAGFGNYEGFNLGLCNSFKKLRLEYGIGTDLNLYGQGFLIAAHASAGRILTLKKPSSIHSLSLNFKITAWKLSNKSNVFSALSPSVEFQYQRKISGHYRLGIFCGAAWTYIFQYERKTYEDVGYAREWLPNFGLTLYRKLK